MIISECYVFQKLYFRQIGHLKSVLLKNDAFYSTYVHINDVMRTKKAEKNNYLAVFTDNQAELTNSAEILPANCAMSIKSGLPESACSG